MTLNDIAIVGYACRLPKASDPDAFWSLLSRGECVISTVQPDRWSKNRLGHPERNVVGRSYTWAAGQIDDIWGFDPTFFGISPREAEQMDPQQRLLLEVVWEAFEHAGILPSAIAGSETGVYVGASGMDYSHALIVDSGAGDTQSMTGNTLSIVSNRISYIFDLKGPSFTVDTACSSSMVAMHEALEAIRAGRIDTAVVAGVNVLLSPFAFIGFSRASMLSPTGLCRAFDAGGDGYVRSEGAVAIVLRRADVAKAAGNPIRSYVAGSGINSDGRTAGLSLPSPEQQAALLEQVYDRFGIDPDSLAYVEAHGTGTRVGDPIEAHALGSVLGRRRRTPLPIGSVKTNIGHLESASGLAGLLKAQLALEHDMLPPSLHFETPNPDIDFAGLNVEVVATARPIGETDGPRHVGINSFGFGGANAHVVLREAEPVSAPAAGRVPLAPLVISARSKDGLAALARRYRDRLAATDDAGAAVIANAAAYRRERLEHRLVITGDSREAMIAKLDDHLAGGRSAISAHAVHRTAPVAFAYSGNGSQFAGMGRAAYRSDASFRTAFDTVNRLFMRVAGWSLVTTLFSEDLDGDIERTEVAQPLLFAVQVALTEALAKRGLKPAAVAGHSVGEVGAAWAAGALTLQQAVFLIHVRSTQQEVTRHLGGMAALLVGAADVEGALADPAFAGLEIAGDNSPRSVTLSGPYETIDAFGRFARKQRWAMRKLKLDYPFHCALIEPIHQDLVRLLAGFAPSEGRVPFVSTVTGDVLATTALDADYWWRNVRQPVLFRQAVERFAGLGIRLVIEIGPKPVLQNYVADSLAGVDHAAAVMASLDEDDETGRDIIGDIVARALAGGAAIDTALFIGPPVAGDVDLPLYPWQHQPYRHAGSPEIYNIFGRGDDHPLLGSQPRGHGGPFIAMIDTALVPWLADHKVDGTVVFPAAGFVEMAFAAAAATLGEGPIELADLDILRPMLLEEGASRETKVEIDASLHTIEIWSRRRLADDDWALHAKVGFSRPPVGAEAARALPDPAAPPVLGHDALYDLTRRFGLDYGPAFARATAIRQIDERTLHVALSAAEADSVGDALHLLHPTLLDASFHGLFCLITSLVTPPAGFSFLPVRIGDARLYRRGVTVAGAIVEVVKASPRSVVAALDLVDAEGAVVARFEEVRFKAVQLSRPDHPDDAAFRVIARRLADPRDAVTLTAALADPMALAAAAGLVGETSDEPGEATLLIDAACRAIAFEALAAFTGDDGIFDVAVLVETGRLAAGALPLVHRLLGALCEDDAAEALDGDARWRLLPASPYPPLAAAVTALLADHPRRIAEVTLLSRLTTALPQRLASGLAATAEEAIGGGALDHLDTASAGSEPRREAGLGLLEAVVAGWPDKAALRVLLVGSGAVAAVRRLAPHRDRIDRLVVADVDHKRVERLRFALSDDIEFDVVELSALGGTGGIDVALAASALGRPQSDATLAALVGALAPGGLLVAGEQQPSLFTDLVRGLGADWWAEGLDPALPLSPPRSAESWKTAFAAAGLDAVAARPVAGDGDASVLLVARRPVAAPAALPASTTSADPVLIVTTADGGATRALGDALSALTAAAGRAVHLASASASATGSACIEPLGGGREEELSVILAMDAAKDLVLLPDLEAGAADPSATLLDATMVIHAILNGAMKPPARLWLVAPGGSGADSAARPHDPVAAGLWGLGRVLMNEYPDIETRLVDLASAFTPAEAASRLAHLLSAPGAERELVVDVDGTSVLRVLPAKGLTAAARRNRIAGDAGRVLVMEQQGSPDGLAWHDVPRIAPQDGEIEIEVAATGLNFRDVMWALGLLPEEALEDGFAGATLGMECSGTVTRVGAGVSRVRPGDRVITFAPACFASHVRVAEKAVARIPGEVDLEAAATIPVTFLTAYYALLDLARLEEGETVLIHGGAGGVGLAALQIALWRGARVIATAGSPDKRALLSMLGAEHVLDSRSLAFHDDVMRITGREGVDVVLNSLFGEAMERSIAVLKPFGRFVELGKRDYYANSRIGLRPFRQNLSYFGVDADQLLTRRPKLAERLFADLVARFEEGAFAPLPYRLFPAEEVTEAFRLMQQSGHIGKILVKAPRPAPAAAMPATTIRPDATYLVVGGLGGFGVETARFLVERGARHLVLASRSGTVSETAAPVIAAMEGAGAEVRVVAADATRRADVDRLLAEIDGAMPPLAGVLHTAMVIDDALFRGLDRARIETVLAPKVAGAFHLDAATRGRPLDLFVLFSSATTLIGNPGQAAYVAANAYLEGLARRRRAAGLPALAMAWGAIADAGYLARNAEVNAMLSMRMGKQSLTARAALEGLGLALDAGLADPVLGYAKMNWGSARRELAIMASPFASVVARLAGDGGQTPAGDGEISKMIAELSGPQAVKLVCDMLAAEISRILRLPAEEIEAQRPLTEFGMDSLMALELRMAAEQKLGLDIPLLSLANGATLANIARKVVERVHGGEGEGAEVSAETSLAAARHSSADDGEMARVIKEIEERSDRVGRLM